MTEAETILKMIENADPEDTAKLDEIDARVHEYLGYYWHGGGSSAEDKIYAGHWADYPDGKRGKGLCECESDEYFAPEPPEYTRSRDALKAIRPKDCWLETGTDIKDDDTYSYRCRLWHWSESRQRREPALPTEELAELHAIIQAIEFERRATDPEKSPIGVE